MGLTRQLDLPVTDTWPGRVIPSSSPTAPLAAILGGDTIMRTFAQIVDARSRQAMVGFLRGHFRYWTMNSWNRATSYANCVKIHKLGLTPEQMATAWQLLDIPEVYDTIQAMLAQWAAERDWEWQVGFNGRSSGYLVLYQGRLDYRNARTARCDACGKLTWHTKGTPCTTGGCLGTLRVLAESRPRVVAYPGRGTDEAVDFGEWDLSDLRARVRLVQEFDRLCDSVLGAFVDFCDNCEVVEREVWVPKTVKVLEAV